MMKKLLFPFVLLFFLTPLFSAEIQPFSWSWQRTNENLSVILSIRDSAHLYAESTSILLKTASEKSLKPASVPKMNVDQKSGEECYSSPRSVWIFHVKESDFPLTLFLAWQGCRDTQCFLPEKRHFTLGKKSSGGQLYGTEEKTSAEIFPGFKIERAAYGYMAPQNFLEFLRGTEKKDFFPAAERNVFLMILLILFGGIALNFTPCVLPMIPVNLMIIGAGKTAENKSQAFFRGSIYACGIALACGISGAAVVLGGGTLGELDSSWIFNGIAAIVFIILGCSLFDLFNIDLSRFKAGFTMPTAARFTGIFLLGALSALLAGACVAPVVIAVFLQSARIYAQGNAAGLLLPFVLGIGMALPWPAAALGILALPRPGKWMKYVKYFFGILILLLGGYYAYLSGTLLFRIPAPESGMHGITSALAESHRTGKPLLIDFRADWCKNCLAMEKRTFKDPAVQKEMQEFIFVKFDATDASSDKVKKILKTFSVTGLPAYLIVRAK